MTTCLILQSIIKIFQIVTEIQAKMKLKYNSGDITRKKRPAELSSLHVTLHIDLIYNAIKIY